MTDYVCVKEIRSNRDTILFEKGNIYPFDGMKVKDELGCFRNFDKQDKFVNEHFKLKEEELSWL